MFTFLYTLTTGGVSSNLNSGALATFLCNTVEQYGLECIGLGSMREVEALGATGRLLPKGDESSGTG